MGRGDAVWEEIERSESFLVSSMFEEAASLAFSILKTILDDCNVISKTALDDDRLHDMLESAGMVLVQSLNGLGRTSKILHELQILFHNVAVIPVQVLFTGICFQISNGSYSGVKETLEEFLSKWTYSDEGYYDINDEHKGCIVKRRLNIDVYMEVVELYAFTFVGTTLKDMELSIDWVEKAALPEERRQGLLRRLHSLFSHKATNASRGSSLLLLQDKLKDPPFLRDSTVSEGSEEVSVNKNYMLNGDNGTNQALLKLSRQRNTSIWSTHLLNIKFGKARLIISNGKLVLSLLVFLLYYLLRKKRTALMRTLRRQVLFLKKALVDLWQLAFSYQVNPLAAVQPLPGPMQGG